MAKTAFQNINCSFHQAVSHWLKTHACIEPFVIATHRTLSVMHPVHKLLRPHLRYTIEINQRARTSLIEAGGVLEGLFTPNRFTMEMTAVAYDLTWRFDQQGLPRDLLCRGMARRKKGSKELELVLPSYPYAEDGLLIWDAMEQFVTDYLNLYYDDKKDGKRVTDDVEMMAWWDEVRFRGHPDKKEGWPEMKDVSSLKDILTTIMWIASAEHAALNFGQYDFSGYFMAFPSLLRKPIPLPNDEEELEKVREDFEQYYMQLMPDPKTALTLMMAVQVLSSHSEDEEYLAQEPHGWIKDPAAVEVHRHFVEALQRAEAEIGNRNRKRYKNHGLPYKLLLPNSPWDQRQGLTGQGIPYSISV
eukprot:jgi/Botrbrau1/12010/Bobra.247_2s0015.1